MKNIYDENAVILTNALSLVMTTGLNSALGFVYWWYAAQTFTPTSVGFASSLISAITLLGTTATLGFGMLLISELPKKLPNAGDLFMTALAICSIFGIILGSAFVFLSPWLSSELAHLLDNPLYAITFAIGTALTSVSIVFDQAMIGLLRGGVQLRRNIFFSVIKLVLLMVSAWLIYDALGIIIFATWVISIFISIMIAFLFERKTFSDLLANAHVVLNTLSGLKSTTIWHHMLDLAIAIPGRSLPIVVTSVLTASLGASYYVAWMIASLVYAVTDALTLVLFASGNKESEVLGQRLKMTLISSFLFVTAANIVIFFTAPLILSLFGETYATDADWALRIMCFGGFALIVKMHFVALRRIFNRTISTSVLFLVFAIVEIIAAIIGSSFGDLTGLTIAWTIILYIEAIIILGIYFTDDRFLITKRKINKA